MEGNLSKYFTGKSKIDILLCNRRNTCEAFFHYVILKNIFSAQTVFVQTFSFPKTCFAQFTTENS